MKPLTQAQKSRLDRFKLASHGTWATEYQAGTEHTMMKTLAARGLVEVRRGYQGDRLVTEYKIIEAAKGNGNE